MKPFQDETKTWFDQVPGYFPWSEIWPERKKDGTQFSKTAKLLKWEPEFPKICPFKIFTPQQIHECLIPEINKNTPKYPASTKTFRIKNSDKNHSTLIIVGDSRYRQFTQTLDSIYHSKITSFDEKAKMPFGNSLYMFSWFNLLVSMKNEYDFVTKISNNRWISHVEKLVNYIRLKSPKYCVIGPTILHAIMFVTEAGKREERWQLMWEKWKELLSILKTEFREVKFVVPAVEEIYLDKNVNAFTGVYALV